jgi:putative ABC transport system permease protein
MFKNFILIALRNLRRHSTYSIINISGLSIGIACSMLILLWVNDETSFDKFIPKSEKLYQVYTNAEFDDNIVSWRSVPMPTYDEMKVADSHIVNSAVTGWGGERLMTVGDIRVMQDGYYASEEFLDMFEFPLVRGNAAEVLDDPSSIVISESLAEILFKDKDPMGEMVKVDDSSILKVTGILKDVPSNSSFEFDYLIPWKHRIAIDPWAARNQTNWGNSSFQVFVELANASDLEATDKGIHDVLTEKGQDDVPRWLFLHPMEDWRLHSNFEKGVATGGMSDYVKLFTVIAMFILVIACINFMNLSTARSERRAKEVGIRKTLGSKRSQIIMQFFGESIFISVLSFVVAILLTLVALPSYNDLVDKQLFLDFASADFWIFASIIIFATGILSGSYPSLYLSSFNPVKTLKGNVSTGKNGNTPRKVLVVLQFGFSIILIISTVVIMQQIKMVKARELGYNQENLLTIPMTDAISDNFEVINQALLRTGAVESITRSNSSITQVNSNNFLGWPGKPEAQRVMFVTIATEYDYAQTMGVEMVYGRDFSREFATDTAAIIVNKTALKLMGLEDPIGTQLDLWGSKMTLIGVIDDVLMGSPYEEVRPTFMILDPNWGGPVSVRLNATNDLQASIVKVQEVFEQYNPAYPFDYGFVDVAFQRKFTTINLTQKLATIFAGLTIFITGLGLFGLASFTAQQRIKEIGIRKVLGASIPSLMKLMSKDFSRLVIVSFVIGAPVAWMLLNNYLERYPMRVEISWWIFPVTGIVALAFALSIVSRQALRAAKANPVKSLRSE